MPNQTCAQRDDAATDRDLSFIWTDGPVTVLLGDVRRRLAELEPESVQCVVTSPPYWGLRDYRVDGQLGLEATPDLYVEQITEVFADVARVLRKDGTLWLNLGDSYAAAPKGPNGDDKSTLSPSGVRVQRAHHTINRSRQFHGIKTKDLVGIPWMVAFALRAAGWWLRSDIIWFKPNPMPESVQDRPSTAHEHLFLLTRSERYYYDADAIRTAYSPETKALSFETMDFSRRDRYRQPNSPDSIKSPHGQGFTRRADKQRNDRWDAMERSEQMATGANARTVWEIATTPYPEAHFATFPEALVEPCVKAGSREGDIVLDPFAGSGTSLAVARRLGRRAIGIELQPDYLPLIQRRVREAALPLVEVMDGVVGPPSAALNEV